MATKRKDPKDLLRRGVPETYRADFHIPEFIRLSKKGKSYKQIARDWDLARSTLYDWAERHPDFAYTMQLGKELSEAYWMDLAEAGTVGGVKIEGKTRKLDVAFFKIVTRNQFGWCDGKSEVTGKDGGPLQVQTFTDLIKELSKDDDQEKD